MKKLCVLALLAVSAFGAAQFSSYGVRLLKHIPLDDLPGSPGTAAAIYGYVSPSGREYATLGQRNGTAIIEVTNPSNPVVVEHIPGPSTLWHENVVMGDYCYSVTDSTGIGIQIIDLSNVDNGVVTLAALYDANDTTKVHTIQADPTTQRLFANGGSRNFAVLDASNPTQLQEIGRWTTKYVHDSIIRNYTSGPYAGKQIGFLCCGTAGLYIVDLTNPGNIQTLGSLNYYPEATNGQFYCHSAALTPDNKYLLVNDEFDEKEDITNSCTTLVVDVQDLANPQIVNRFESGVNTIDHNSLLRDGYLYLAAYKAGLRIYNALNPPTLSEIGFIDTYPQSTNSNSYNGNWGVYSLFPSGNVVLSDIDNGFFVVDPSEAIGLGAPLTTANITTAGATGSLSDLRKSDDKYVGFVSVAPLTVLAETTINPRAKLKVSIEARGNTVYSIKLRNQVTQSLDSIGSFNPGGSGDNVLQVSDLPAGTYVNVAGQIECQITAGLVGTRTGPRNRIDMVRFDVQP